MGFAYFLDPKTKAVEGFVDDDLYDNAILLKEFIKTKRFADEDICIQKEYETFVQDMKNSTEKAETYIKHNSAITFWLTVGATKYPSI